ncbi:PAS domain S-box protein [bacterium]|nr:PAS domain S-box protein [bacterium]
MNTTESTTPAMQSDLEYARGEIRRLNDLIVAILKAHDDLGYGVVITDGSQIRYVNEAFAKMSGYSFEELLALPSFFGMVPEVERTKLMQRMQERLRGEAVRDHYTTALTHKSGTWIDLEVVVKVAHLDAIPHVIAIVKDIA